MRKTIDPGLLRVRLAAATGDTGVFAGAYREHVTALLRLVEQLHKDGASTGDWACRECWPQSDMLVDGFLCAYHEAGRLRGIVDPHESTEPTG
jgi:hypothetical protein